MSLQGSNIVPLRRAAPPEREPEPTAAVIRFPGNWEDDVPRTGDGDVDGPAGQGARANLYKSVCIVAVVLTPRYWLGWLPQVSIALTIAVAVGVGFSAFITWANLRKKYHYALYALLVIFAVSAFYVPFMVAPGIMSGVLIWARRVMNGHLL